MSLAFQKLQTALTAHIRNPEAAPAPCGIEDRRLAIYRELFYNNIEGSLASAFPVIRRITDDAAWHALVRDFFARHRAHTPLFHQLAQEFLGYLEHTRSTLPGDPPFLQELAHYEWVELALSVAEDALTPALADPNGDLLEAPPLVSPLAWTLAYDYPVHRIGPEFLPTAPDAQPTYLVVYRTRQDAIKFTEINAVTARLLELIEAQPAATGRMLLTQIARELGMEDPAPLILAGQQMLQGLRARDVILGTRHSS